MFEKTPESFVLYNNALTHLLTEYKGKELVKKYCKQLVFYGVKTIISTTLKEDCSFDEVQNYFNLICFIKIFMMKLTPSDIENIFPIQKIYDGERRESKDYFYTKHYLNSLDSCAPLGENLEELLWEYVNPELRKFNLAQLKAIDFLRKFEGKQGIMEEWVDANKIQTYFLRKDGLGKEYFYDRKTGRTIKAKKKRPKYLRVIK